MYWRAEPVFAGQRAFCLASGPSMSAEVAEAVRGRPSVAVNVTGTIAPHASVLFWNDNSWFETFRGVVEGWHGLAVTTNRHSKRAMPEKVNLVRHHAEDRFRFEDGAIREGRTSGHMAISLAIAMGAAEVVLLGFDMRVNGQEHFHLAYTGERDLSVYERLYVPAFAGWNEQALREGVKIWNATPGSAVDEFERARLEDLI